MVTKKFTCPTCNAGCGLLVEVENNAVVSVKPNPAHPISKGFCCPKGLSLGYVTNDKDRVRTPLKRIEGKFQPISWKRALLEISERLTELKNKHGPNSIAYYMGTNSVHQYAHSMFVKGFMDAIGSSKYYTAGSVDNNNKFVAQYFLYGSSVVMPIPDLPRSDLVLLIGTNPAETNLSLVTCANIVKVLKGIKQRGGEIYVIDPRRNETAKLFTKRDDGHYVPIVPDTDAFFLMALLNVIFTEGLEDKAFLRDYCEGSDTLKKITIPFTPELVETVCAISSEKIREIARKFAATKRAVAYGRLGTCLSTFSTLNAWAIDVLNIVGGKLDRPGGAIFGHNVINIAKLGKIAGMGSYDNMRSRIGSFPDVMGAFPLGILAREVQALKNPVRALLISGGNPALSAPNSNEFKKALESLEFCVVFDFYINETAQQAAHYILPTRTPLENSNIPVYLLNYQVTPHVDYSYAMVVPNAGGPKPEWEILASLARLMKVPMFGSALLDMVPNLFRIVHKEYSPEFMIRLFLFVGQFLDGKIPKLTSGTWTLKKLKKREFALVGPQRYGVLKDYVRTKDKKIQLINPQLEEQITSCGNALTRRTQEMKTKTRQPNEFLMIGRRNLKTMNSWLHNIESLWRQKQEPKLLINKHDAERLNLNNNEFVAVENERGEIKVPIEITEDILSGVVCYPHGWGHKNPHLSFANQHPGENVNVLTSSYELEKLSGMPLMNGYKVRLKKLK